MRHTIKILALVMSVCCSACADKEAPTWPSGAKLDVSAGEKGTAKIEWKGAGDSRGVVNYSIKQGDAVLTETGTGELQAFAENLADLTEYEFSVTARDEAGNVSDSLTAKFVTPDWTPPAWEDGHELGVMLKDVDNNSSGLMLSWDPAVDNDGVTKYTISRNGKDLGSIPGNVGSFHVTSTPFNGTYVVGACDKAGNCAVTPAKAVDTSVLRRVAMMSSILAGVVFENEGNVESLGTAVGDLFKNPKDSSLTIGDVDLSEILNSGSKLTDMDLAEKMGLGKLGADVELLKSGTMDGSLKLEMGSEKPKDQEPLDKEIDDMF